MKNKFFYSLVAFLCICTCSFCLTGCFGGGVVPCAWVRLDMEGYIVYTSNMYGGDHIYLYENEEEARDDMYHSAYLLSIGFYPRILGADTIDGERTTTVDISSNYSMHVYVNKTRSLYDSNKKVYLNGEQLSASQTDDLDSLLCLSFENFTFVRGNPNGHLNGFVNLIEYK